ncbi:MAG TPA: hypothetical protein VGM93_00820 [Acidimicrobiales bacterium]
MAPLAPSAEPSTDVADDREGSSRGRLVGRILTGLVALGLIAMWGWIFITPDRHNPDWLNDRALAKRMQGRCETMLTSVHHLTPAYSATAASSRADTVDHATALLRSMVADIQSWTPAHGDDHTRLTGWIHDWHTYFNDRDDYTRRLRKDPRAQFLVESNKAGDPIDTPLTNFADANDLPQCEPPGDVG